MLGRLRRARQVFEEAERSHSSAPRRAAPPLARDALVVMLDPETGKTAAHADLIVPGAVLVELAREGRLGASGTGKKVSLTVRDRTPVGDELLDDALLTVHSGLYGQRATRHLSFLQSDYYVRKSLLDDGSVVEETRRILGTFTVRRHRPTPAAGRDALVTAVRSALLGESVPDERTALLISILRTGLPLRGLVPKKQVREAGRRAREILDRIGDDERAVVSALGAAVDRARGD